MPGTEDPWKRIAATFKPIKLGASSSKLPAIPEVRVPQPHKFEPKLSKVDPLTGRPYSRDIPDRTDTSQTQSRPTKPARPKHYNWRQFGSTTQPVKRSLAFVDQFESQYGGTWTPALEKICSKQQNS